MARGAALAVLLSFLARAASAAEAEPDAPRRLSVGLNNLGGQVRLHATPEWAGEARVVTGRASSDAGTVNAVVLGLRGYRFSRERRRCRLYLGLEGAYVQTSLQGGSTGGTRSGSLAGIQGFGDASGYALGAFGGIEFRPLGRVALDVDMGPYVIGLREKVTRTSGSSWDFVANTAVNVYLF